MCFSSETMLHSFVEEAIFGQVTLWTQPSLPKTHNQEHWPAGVATFAHQITSPAATDLGTTAAAVMFGE